MSPKYSDKLAFKLSLNIIIVVTICTIIIKAIINWASAVTAFSNIMSLLSPFFIGVFIAYLLHPLVKRFEKNLFYERLHIKPQRLRQFLAIFISYVIAISLLTVFLIVVIPQIGTSLYDLLGLIQKGANIVTEFILNLETQYPNINFEYFENAWMDAFPSIVEYLTNLIKSIIPKIYSISVSVISWLLNFIIAIVVSCYILADRKMLICNCKRIMYALFSKEKTQFLISTFKSCNDIFGGFIIGKFIDSLIIGVLCAIILLIADIPFALLISLIVGISNMIPYFGPIIGAIPGICILLISNPYQAFIFLIIVIILQQLDGNILDPMIVGDSIGIRPLWIIFAITVGGYVAGPVGMFLGVPTIAVISFLANNWISKKLEEKDIVVNDYITSSQGGFFSKLRKKLFKKEENEDEE